MEALWGPPGDGPPDVPGIARNGSNSPEQAFPEGTVATEELRKEVRAEMVEEFRQLLEEATTRADAQVSALRAEMDERLIALADRACCLREGPDATR
jgi:hypothetical protein